ncbi:hypothetical protein [Streptomyces sp. NPDC102487]
MIDISELRTTGYRAAHRLRAHHHLPPTWPTIAPYAIWPATPPA